MQLPEYVKYITIAVVMLGMVYMAQRLYYALLVEKSKKCRHIWKWSKKKPRYLYCRKCMMLKQGPMRVP